MIKADDIITAVAKVLQADTTLQGSDYLNGTTLIDKGPRIPEQKVGSEARGALVMLGGQDVGVEAPLQDGTLYVKAFVENYEDGSARTDIISNICNRVEELLHKYALTIAGARVFNLLLVTPHSDCYYDPAQPNKHNSVSVFRFQAISL